MKLGDFASLVQLGVGLHAGTAMFQFIAEFASNPISTKVERLEKLAKAKSGKNQDIIEIVDDIKDISSDLELAKLKFFSNYRTSVIINSLISLLLIFALIYITFNNDDAAIFPVTIILTFFSIGPALYTVINLSLSWSQNTELIRSRVAAVEAKLLSGIRN